MDIKEKRARETVNAVHEDHFERFLEIEETTRRYMTKSVV